jgi:periplasmic protein CpxP/Spy
MKRQILLIAIAVISSITVVNAQGGEMQRRTPEERLATIHAKIDSAFKPDAVKMAKLDTIFLNALQAQDKAREEMMQAGGPPDREAMREKNQKLMAERDALLKVVFTEAEMKIWKEEIEPSMRPRRGNRPQ